MDTEPPSRIEPLPFTDEEYAARLAAVRRNMEAAGVEVMLTAVPENIVYLSGYHSLGYFTFQLLVVPLDHPPILLVRGVARHKARIDSCLEHVIGYFDTEDPDEATYKLLRDYGLLDRRIGNQNDAWFFSPARYRKLVARLGLDDLPDCSGLVEAVRRRKSPREIEYLREAGRYCAASLEAAIEAVRPGVLETEISAAAHEALHRAGSDDVVYMEAGGTHNRYNCMLSRTVIVGNPDPKWARMAEASRDALEAAKAATRAGVTSHEVDLAGRNVMRKAGFADGFEHRLGYSIGIGFPPDWGEGRIMSINENDPLVLEPGMCFHYIPDLKFPHQGGVVFSECLSVTETGYELLSDYPSEIFRK